VAVSHTTHPAFPSFLSSPSLISRYSDLRFSSSFIIGSGSFPPHGIFLFVVALGVSGAVCPTWIFVFHAMKFHLFSRFSVFSSLLPQPLYSLFLCPHIPFSLPEQSSVTNGVVVPQPSSNDSIHSFHAFPLGNSPPP